MPNEGKSSNPRELTAGQRVFDRYYLKRTLGHGGMGVVWLAHDRVLEQPVALKFLADHLFEDHHEIERLKLETRRNLKLSHPNIVRIHDFEQDAQRAAIAMEYIDGWSLWAMRVDKPRHIFEVTEISPWIRDVCDALDYAHNQAHIVHRDLKPANLLLNSRGQIKVTDFGLSRDLRSTQAAEAHPKIVGTDIYMSPQQWTGEAPAVADDVYSLGVTIYELLTGKPPFYEGDVFKQLFEDTPPSMTERLHQFGIDDVTIPLVWEEMVAACLAKEADRRPVSVREVAVRLGLIEVAGSPPKSAAPVAAPPDTGTPVELQMEATAPESTETISDGQPARSVFLNSNLLTPKRIGIVAGSLLVLGLFIWMIAAVSKSKSEGNTFSGTAPGAPLDQGEAWKNSLGMKFVSVPDLPVLFATWETRVQDFEVFVRETGFNPGNDLYRMNSAGQWRRGGTSWRDPDFSQGADSPVIGVTWRDAEAFCAWLTNKERKAGLLAGDQAYRLPTATEWMRAAGDAFYPWGDNWPPPTDAGNYAGAEIREAIPIHRTISGYNDGFVGTSPVGSFAPNQHGIYDLGGNVWELCSDGPSDDPNSRWMMGGSWENAHEETLAVANRVRASDARRYTHRGFRCVLVLSDAEETAR